MSSSNDLNLVQTSHTVKLVQLTLLNGQIDYVILASILTQSRPTTFHVPSTRFKIVNESINKMIVLRE